MAALSAAKITALPQKVELEVLAAGGETNTATMDARGGAVAATHGGDTDIA